MEFKLNNKGFSLREFVLVLLIMVIVVIVVLTLFFKGNKSTTYKSFRNLAKDLSINATQLRDSNPKYGNKVFLYDLIKDGYVKDFPNPFSKKGNCDEYESKVVFIDNSHKKVTLKCGEYLIFNEDGYKDAAEYTIYKVSEWTDQETHAGNVHSQDFYNLSENGKMMFDKYFTEKELITNYTKKTGDIIFNISQIDASKYKLEKKTYYRTMDEVD